MKKKVLLIHPLGTNWIKGENDYSRIANLMVPMGICNIAAYLDEKGHNSYIHDCYAHFDGNDALFTKIREISPDFIGFSTTTSSFHDGISLAEQAREILPGVKIVFGGVHASALRESLIRDYAVIDYIVVGEGEQTLVELIESKGEKDLGEIKGLAWRKQGKPVFNGQREELLDMDELPFPAYEKLENYPADYQLPIFSYPHYPNTTITTSRGCPFCCSYCDRSVFRQSYRYNSPEYVLSLMRYLQEKFKIKHVNIYDDTFLLNRDRIMEFCEKKLASGLKMTYNCAARAEQVDEAMLKLLKKSGCWMISIGMETGDPDLLKRHRSYLEESRPENPLEDIKEKCHLIKKAGIRVKGLFMMGLPGETAETIKRTMEYVFSLPLDDFNLAKFTPFPGAPLYKSIHQLGEFEENWDIMNALNFVFVTRGISKDQLEKSYKEFYRKYFSRPSIGWNYFTMLWKSPDSWYRFLKNLPDFMRIKNSFKE